VAQAICNGTNIRRLTARGLACILLSSNLAICDGQGASAPGNSRSPSKASASGEADRTFPTIFTHSDLVVIPVTVTDSKGRVVNGLKKEHFKLYEDKVEQVITHFASDDAPVSIGFVFDISASMTPKLGKAREAVAALLKNANPEDEFFLVQFNHRAEIAVAVTRQREEIQNRLTQTVPNGRTALLDAVLLAMKEMKNAHHTRKALVIISDGDDNASRTSVRKLNEAVGGADMLIYAISIVDSPGSDSWLSMNPSGSALLNEIAKQTGGRVFQVAKLRQLPDVASRIGAWLRSQYVLGYPPNNLGNNGQYRRIEVKLIKPKGSPRVHVSWRLGYYAPSE
jgi:Ca-activated chloride channel family protein